MLLVFSNSEKVLSLSKSFLGIMELKVSISRLFFNRFDSVTDFSVARSFHRFEFFTAIDEGALDLVCSLVRNPIDELTLRFAGIALHEVRP